MDYFEHGKRTARDLMISGRKNWHPPRYLLKKLSILKQASQKQKEGFLHDRFYLVYREGKAALQHRSFFRSLRHTGNLPFIYRVLSEYFAASNGSLSQDTLEQFLSGIAEEKGLEEYELLSLRSVLALLLISAIAEDMNNPIYYDSIQLLGRIDFECLHALLSPVERILLDSPDYSGMNEETRGHYRHAIADQSKTKKLSEWDYAQSLLSCEASTGLPVGSQLFPRYGKDRCGLRLLPLSCMLLSLILSGIGWYFYGIQYAVIAFPLFYECVMQILKKRGDPSFLFGMDYSNGIPCKDAALCVITTLLTKEEDINRLISSMEGHYLREKKSKNLFFGLLLDLPDNVSSMTESEKSMIEHISSAINNISRKYNVPFYAFIRPRSYLSSEKRYMPRERKRGALLSLCALLSGRESELSSLTGSIPQVQYLITLDSDTIAHPESLKHLVETAAHPMNRPGIVNGKVKSGFGIISPRLLTNPMSTEKTSFADLQSPSIGYNLYDMQGSGIYGATIGQSPFAGKGLLHIASVNLLLSDCFPDNTILSHDIPEGGILRCGIAGNAVCYESIPETCLSWFRRLERWTRGDIQNISLFRKVGDAGRFFITENFRGAFLPVSTLIFLYFVYSHGILWGSIPLLFLLFAELWKYICGLWLNGTEYMPRWLTGLCHAGTALAACCLRILLLPYHAFVTQKAIWTALFRLLITKKNLLSWNSTAPASESILSYAGAMLIPSVLAGGFIPVLLPLWSITFLVMYRLSCPASGPEYPISSADREYLCGLCRDTIKGLRLLCSEKWGYLPADHIQLYPYRGITKVTSPTNIGMALLAFLCYKDLSLPGADECLLIARRMLDRLEMLPRYRGHFYNWYDLNTMQPTDPKIISSVDSGNLCACLYCFSVGIRAYGFEQSARKAEGLADNMHFDIFYNPKTKYLSAGMNRDGTLMENHYDLYESEARTASFLGCARGELPLSHWNALGRPMMTWKGYAGAASWSGTMFEYLTPHLFLKAPQKTLCREGEAFSVFMQKKHGEKGRLPWGISESCFFAFDQEFSYRYKANGVSETALAPRRNGEYIVAPYAACMALEYAGSTKNLRHIQNLGGRGKYGFYDALDATQKDQIQAVECYMSHHIGMSVASVTNYLCHNILRERFLEKPQIKAFLPLLWEDASHGPAASAISGEAPPGSLGKGEGANVFFRPRKENKHTIALLLDGHLLSLFPDGHMEYNNHKCLDNALAISCENEITSVTPYPFYQSKAYTAFFANNKALFTLREEAYTSELQLDFSSANEISMKLTLHNNTDSLLDLTLHRIKTLTNAKYRSITAESIQLDPQEIRIIPIAWI